MLKRFHFFTSSKVDIKNNDNETLLFHSFKLTTVGGIDEGCEWMALGSDHGQIALVGRDMICSKVFEAYSGQSVLKIVQRGRILCTVNDCPNKVLFTELKLWNLNDASQPVLCNTFSLSMLIRNAKGGKPHWASDVPKEYDTHAPHIVEIAATSNFEQIAIGFSDGHVLVIRHEEGISILNGKIVDLSVSTLPNFKSIGVSSVTGLGYWEDELTVWLWVATNKSLSSYCTDQKNKRQLRTTFGGKAKLTPIEPGVELDGEGCAQGCACVAKDREQFVLTKNDRVQFYSFEDPGSVYAVISGKKTQVAWMDSYLAVVSAAPSGNPGDDSGSSSKEVLQLYDFKNKFIALSFDIHGEQFGRAMFLVHQWNRLMLFTQQNQVVVFKEKDLDTKLNDLFKRNLYATSISLATASGCDKDRVAKIHKMYGDHLFAKGSFDEAMQQYVRVIGHIEPSYVIRRYLDSQRIENLIQFLEALHSNSDITPTGDHTTLLLNCYTKQKHEEKLAAYLNKYTSPGTNIDVNAAVSVLLAARYFDQALMIAKSQSNHKVYVEILMEHLHKYDEVIKYIRGLQGGTAEFFMQRYGNVLLTQRPKDTAEILTSLCTDAKSTWREAQGANPESFLHLFVDHPQQLFQFLRTIILSNNATPLIWNTYLELVVSQYTESVDDHVRNTKSEEIMSVLKDSKASYDATQALVLLEANQFHQGLLYLYEKLHMHHMLIKYYMEQGNHEAVMTKCRVYAASDPNLWVQVLMYLAEQEMPSEEEIQEVLHHIEKTNVMPTMMVLELLAKNPKLKLSTIRPYILGQLLSSQRLIEDHNNAIAHLKSDTDNMKREIVELKTRPKVFTSTKCNLTGAPLELPTVHFLSGNSYNLNSLPGGSAAADAAAVATAHARGPAPSMKILEDPKCVAEQNSVTEIMRKLQQNAVYVDEEFFNQLEISQDGFGTVAEYFSKCLFDDENKNASDNRAPEISYDTRHIPFPPLHEPVVKPIGNVMRDAPISQKNPFL